MRSRSLIFNNEVLNPPKSFMKERFGSRAGFSGSKCLGTHLLVFSNTFCKPIKDMGHCLDQVESRDWAVNTALADLDPRVLSQPDARGFFAANVRPWPRTDCLDRSPGTPFA